MTKLKAKVSTLILRQEVISSTKDYEHFIRGPNSNYCWNKITLHVMVLGLKDCGFGLETPIYIYIYI